VVSALGELSRTRCERFERLRIRGLDRPLSIYQWRWEGAAATEINTLDATQVSGPTQLILEGPDGVLRVAVDAGSSRDTVIGRDPTCDFVIDHPRVSRFHATVEFHDGQFFLRDHSTNGSLLQSQSEATGRPLRRTAALLRGRGAVQFGHVTQGGDLPGLRFEVA
jgi:adenylate cyclase